MGLLTPDADRTDDRDEQKRDRMDMQNIGEAGAPSTGPADSDYVDRITDSNLDQGTVDILENMLSQDWVLGNLDDAEVHEIRWLVRVMMMQLESLHPPADGIWTGELRQYASGNQRQALEPLDPAQKLVIFELIQGVIARATRSKDGWQQEIFRKQIRQSETVDRSNDDEGGWLS